MQFWVARHCWFWLREVVHPVRSGRYQRRRSCFDPSRCFAVLEGSTIALSLVLLAMLSPLKAGRACGKAFIFPGANCYQILSYWEVHQRLTHYSSALSLLVISWRSSCSPHPKCTNCIEEHQMPGLRQKPILYHPGSLFQANFYNSCTLQSCQIEHAHPLRWYFDLGLIDLFAPFKP